MHPSNVNQALNPGNLKTGLQQHMGGLSTKIFVRLVYLHKMKHS